MFRPISNNATCGAKQAGPAAGPLRRAHLCNASPRVNAATVIERRPAQEVVAASSYDLLEESANGQFERDFRDYAAATQKMEDLEKLSEELLANLNDLNTAADALDVMMPSPTVVPKDQEARRAKRAAAREARKASGSTATISAPKTKKPIDRQNLERMQPKEASSTALRSAVVDEAAQSSTISGASNSRAVIFPRPDALATQERRLGQTSRNMMAGPSLTMTSPSDVQAEPSARARAANARRARVSSRRGHAASGVTDAAKLGSRSTSSGDGTTQFMKKAATLDLLNGISEKELAAIVKDLLFLERVRKDVKSILKREPTMDEWSKAVNMEPRNLQARISAGQQAKAMMLQANYRLVISVCKKYQNRGIALQDLITEGVNGLLKGVEKFDADKGFRFSTYAHWWIRQAVTRSLSDQGRTVRLPAHMYELLVRIQAAKQELTEELGSEPSMEHLTERTKLTAERIREVLEMARPSGSLDQAVGDDDGMSSMKDMLEDDRSTPDEVLDEVMLRKDLVAILSELSEREAGVIRLRFGLDGEQEMTLEDIGIHFKVTRERIRQIEAKAVRKLKQKQKELASILNEYSSGSAEAIEMAGRRSQGTNKSG